ncbi:uncharacterized protein LOC125648429 [Ostrea edulis]|uniref:uncharacterized protein LOC125648429 n=1 Tax=Ostrea edulis TaxID=37623 RepID=UPI0024AF63AB|nr:uncharacterized protein LOC125648429 [Ostrea edulis]
MFNERHEILKDLAEKSWNEVEDVLVTIGTCEKDLKKLREGDSLLNTKFKQFCKHSSEYENYLSSINTEESTQLLSDYKVYMNKCISIVKRASNDLKTVKLELIETMSRVSSNGSLASIKRTKAEAGKAKLQFIKQEGQLMRQKADIEAELNVTRQQKEIAALEAETKVLEGGSDKSCNDLPSEIADKEEMTKKFVMDDHVTDSRANIDHIPHVNPPPVELPNTQPVDINEPVPQYHNTGLTNFHGIPTVNIPQNPSPVYIPTASRYKFTPTNIPPENPCVAPMIDFSKFMLRKDLLLTRFSKFDDKAETFAAWSAQLFPCPYKQG